jgi:DNA-binding response OmpR family regulator
MKRILIIDDDLDLCTLLSNFLKKKGFETDMAFSGNKGIAKFKDVISTWYCVTTDLGIKMEGM